MAGLRALGVLAVIMLAVLGVLFVFDVIPRETMESLAVKSLAFVGILGAASLSIGLLLKAPKT